MQSIQKGMSYNPLNYQPVVFAFVADAGTLTTHQFA